MDPRGSTGGALLIDASPRVRGQFLERDVALPDAVLGTHVQFDHLNGLGNAARLLGPRGVATRPSPLTPPMRSTR
jgi:phosphoribosyl 1,2-cyclic phosphate phosphodiesterase